MLQIRVVLARLNDSRAHRTKSRHSNGKHGNTKHSELLETARAKNGSNSSPIGRRFLRGDLPAELYSWTQAAQPMLHYRCRVPLALELFSPRADQLSHMALPQSKILGIHTHMHNSPLSLAAFLACCPIDHLVQTLSYTVRTSAGLPLF